MFIWHWASLPARLFALIHIVVSGTFSPFNGKSFCLTDPLINCEVSNCFRHDLDEKMSPCEDFQYFFWSKSSAYLFNLLQTCSFAAGWSSLEMRLCHISDLYSARADNTIGMYRRLKSSSWLLWGRCIMGSIVDCLCHSWITCEWWELYM